MQKTSPILETSKVFAKQLITGLNQSVTPFHAIDYCKSLLVADGFKELIEKYVNNIIKN